jgi:hypothetical protein
MTWSIAARSSRYKKHAKNSLIGRMLRNIEYAKAQVRAKVEHPFRVIKRQVTAIPTATKEKNRGRFGFLGGLISVVDFIHQ